MITRRIGDATVGAIGLGGAAWSLDAGHTIATATTLDDETVAALESELKAGAR